MKRLLSLCALGEPLQDVTMLEENYNSEAAPSQEELPDEVIIELRHAYYEALIAYHGKDIKLEVGQYVCPRKNWKVGYHKSGVTATCRKVYPKLLKLIQASDLPRSLVFKALLDRATVLNYDEPNLAYLPNLAYVKANASLGYEISNSVLIKSTKYKSKYNFSEKQALATGKYYQACFDLDRSTNVNDYKPRAGSQAKINVGFWYQVMDCAKDAGMAAIEYIDFIIKYQKDWNLRFPTKHYLVAPRFIKKVQNYLKGRIQVFKDRSERRKKSPEEVIKFIEKANAKTDLNIENNKKLHSRRPEYDVAWLIRALEAQKHWTWEDACRERSLHPSDDIRKLIYEKLPNLDETRISFIKVSEEEECLLELEALMEQME